MISVCVDQAARVEVGPGCYRKDLPSRNGLRLWIVEMDPGAEWPHVDYHANGGEDVFVAKGVLIEGDIRHEAGTFLQFAPHSSHRPRTDVGVQLFGINKL